MILHYRNRAFKRLGLSILFFILIFVLAGMRSLGLPEVLIAIGGIVLGTFGLFFYIQGNIALAEAKGHDSSAVVAIIIVAALCLGGLFFGMPLILLFGLNDKTRKRKHRGN